MALEAAERFLAWLQIEQGRADKTIERIAGTCATTTSGLSRVAKMR